MTASPGVHERCVNHVSGEPVDPVGLVLGVLVEQQVEGVECRSGDLPVMPLVQIAECDRAGQECGVGSRRLAIEELP